MIGLKKGTVKLAKSQSLEWHEEFEKEKQILQAKIGNDVLEIHHIGSTSIPGLMAKPIIDIIVVIDELENYRKLVKPLQDIGYHFMPDGVFEIRDRVFFPKGPESSRTHHLSLTTKDSPQYSDNLLFRDYLRNNEKVRKDYQKLKLKLSGKFANDRKSYTEAKANFITKTLREAKSARISS